MISTHLTLKLVTFDFDPCNFEACHLSDRFIKSFGLSRFVWEEVRKFYRFLESLSRPYLTHLNGPRKVGKNAVNIAFSALVIQ